MVTRDTGNVLDLFVLSLVAVRGFLSPRIEEACERSCEKCLRSGSRHLVDTCTWLIVAHRHARTSSHSAERLNLCLSGKELRMLSSMFHLSLFLVTCARSQGNFGSCDLSISCGVKQEKNIGRPLFFNRPTHAAHNAWPAVSQHVVNMVCSNVVSESIHHFGNTPKTLT